MKIVIHRVQKANGRPKLYVIDRSGVVTVWSDSVATKDLELSSVGLAAFVARSNRAFAGGDQCQA